MACEMLRPIQEGLMGTELKRVCGQWWRENPGKFAEKGHVRLFPPATELPPIVL